ELDHAVYLIGVTLHDEEREPDLQPSVACGAGTLHRALECARPSNKRIVCRCISAVQANINCRDAGVGDPLHTLLVQQRPIGLESYRHANAARVPDQVLDVRMRQRLAASERKKQAALLMKLLENVVNFLSRQLLLALSVRV